LFLNNIIKIEQFCPQSFKNLLQLGKSLKPKRGSFSQIIHVCWDNNSPRGAGKEIRRDEPPRCKQLKKGAIIRERRKRKKLFLRG
jgi:hypothetical protein